MSSRKVLKLATRNFVVGTIAIVGFAIAHYSHKILKGDDSTQYSNVSNYYDSDILNKLAKRHGDMGSVNEIINDRFLGENVPFGLGDLLIGILAVVSIVFSTWKICQYDDSSDNDELCFADRTRCKCFKCTPAILLGFSIQFLIGTLVLMTVEASKEILGAYRPDAVLRCEKEIKDAGAKTKFNGNCTTAVCKKGSQDIYDLNPACDHDLTNSHPSGHSAHSSNFLMFMLSSSAIGLFLRYLTDDSYSSSGISCKRVLTTGLIIVMALVSISIPFVRVLENRHFWQNTVAGYSIGIIISVLISVLEMAEMKLGVYV